jgi:ATP-binding cassette subfamily F protein 1
MCAQDMESIEALAEALNAFEGGVILVSHDARLIQAAECRLWVVDHQQCIQFPGTFEEYRDKLLDKLEKEQAEAEALAAANARAAAEKRARRIDELRRKYKALEH